MSCNDVWPEEVWNHIRSGADPNNHLVGHTDIFPLQAAVMNDMPDAVALLLQAGANSNIRGHTRETFAPLNIAIHEGNDVIVGLLLYFGANPNVRDDYYDTPLEAAILYNRVNATALLIAHGANVRVRSRAGCTSRGYVAGSGSLLGYAAGRGHIEIAQLLFDAGIICNEIHGNEVDNALYEASRHNQGSFVCWLIAKNANVNVNVNYHGTPLFNAAGYNNIDMAGILLKHGANVNAIIHSIGYDRTKTALDNAGTIEMINLLKEAGGKTFAELGH